MEQRERERERKMGTERKRRDKAREKLVRVGHSK